MQTPVRLIQRINITDSKKLTKPLNRKMQRFQYLNIRREETPLLFYFSFSFAEWVQNNFVTLILSPFGCSGWSG